MIALAPAYRRRPSPLHAAGAGPATAFCLAPAACAVLLDHPLVLLASTVAVVAAAAAAAVGPELVRAARLAVPFALLIALVNPLVSSEGETILVRGWALAGHRFDVTLEAVAYGGVAGLRVLAIVLAFALFSAAVDPDELLRSLRRLSYRSALTTALATRFVPVLARDATRMGEAARCRAVPAGRTAVARAALSGALDRAVEVAAALEVRGYARAGRPARGRRPRSRHDARVLAAAGLIVAVAVAARAAGAAGFAPYPELEIALGPAELALAAALPAAALLPFAGASARMGVAVRA